MLTAVKVAKAKPRAQRYEIAEPGGLRLCVHPTGARSFLYRYRDPRTGKAAKITLPANTTLHNARALINGYRAALADRQDPARLRKPAVSAPEIKATTGGDTVGELWQTFKGLPSAGGKLRALDQKIRAFDRFILPAFGGRHAGSIKRSEVTAWQDRLEHEHGERSSDLALAHLRRLLRWHEAREDDFVCVITASMSRYDSTEHERERTLTDDELRSVWAAAGDMPVIGNLLRFLLCTGARLREASEARWKEIDSEGVWTVPAARAKGRTGRAKPVVRPLSKLALSVLPPRVEGCAFVFTQNGCGHLSNNYDRWRNALAESAGIAKDWTWHDLRRTMRSLASRAGVRDDIGELLLGHTIKGVRRVYDRHSFLSEKAAAYDTVATLLLEIVAPKPTGDVITMTRRKRRAA
jgi:integrase